MSFGFGAGDFIAVATLATKLYTAFKSAPAEFAEICRELESLNLIILNLSSQAEDSKSALNRYGATRRAELSLLTANLHGTMEELQELYQKYQGIGPGSWLRFRLGMEDLDALRGKLTVHIACINAFVGSLNAAALLRMEPMLETIYQLLKAGMTADKAKAKTVISVRREGKDSASWPLLKVELRSSGVPQEFIDQNSDAIMEIVSKVAQLNEAEDLVEVDAHEGTIYTDDAFPPARVVSTRLLNNSASPGVPRTHHETSLSSSEQLSQDSSSPAIGDSRIALPTRTIETAMAGSSDIYLYGRRRNISAFEEVTRERLMNQGFDIREMEIHPVYGHTSIGEESLIRNQNLSATPGLAARAMITMAMDGDIPGLKLLLDRGCDASALFQGVSAIFASAACGEWIAVKLLADAVTGNTRIGYTWEDHVDRERPERRAKDDIYPKLKWKPGRIGLVQMAAEANEAEVLRLLLPSRRDNPDVVMSIPGAVGRFKSKDTDREFLSMTALHYAARKDAVKAVEVLLQKRASVNRKTAFGNTPLHFAVEYSSLHLISLLLKAGADINARRAYENDIGDTVRRKLDGYTALQIILRCGSNFDDLNIVKRLIHYGADVNVQDRFGRTALHLLFLFNILSRASARENAEFARVLVEAGVDPTRLDNSGKSIMDLALAHNDMCLAKYLDSLPVKISVKDSSKDEGLERAADFDIFK